MARPLRIEYAGALYHVTARGNTKNAIYLSDEDRVKFLSLLSNTCNRHHWHCHVYCLMSNHYHLLIETREATLSRGMKYLNGTYTQSFNRQNNKVGHVLQGRYKAILIQRGSYRGGQALHFTCRCNHTEGVRPYISHVAATEGVRPDLPIFFDNTMLVV